MKDDFLQGICVALTIISSDGDGVLWAELVKTAGVDALLQYAAHVEPEEWETAGFKRFAKAELGRSKPRKPRKPPITTTPAAQRTWVGLTDEEQIALLKDSDGKTRHWLVWQVEAKLKEKNT
jgi:hypothetical protein